MQILKAILFAVTLTTFQCSSVAANTNVYFSPNGGCTEAIVRELKLAKREIAIQAYSFTSVSIAQAIIDAKRRGVHVVAVLDKTNDKGARYSAAKFLFNEGIPVFIDYRPAIAHSKVIVIDRKTLITGSFNFTKAAEEKNVENLIVIKRQSGLAKTYLANIQWRIRNSHKYSASR